MNKLFERLEHFKKYENKSNYDLEHIAMEMLHTKIKDVLDDSCFYYSAGTDIMPIIACKEFISSYVFCDIGEGGHIIDDISKLKNTMREQDFLEIQKVNINGKWLGLENSIYKGHYELEREYRSGELYGDFSIWECDNKFYSLLYIVWDNTATWINLYRKYNSRPKVICNYQYEGGVDFSYVGFPEEMKPDYWIGNAKWGEYELIDTVKYYGSYSDYKVNNERVNFYKKKNTQS